eukprot:Gb_17142 [translate_table: standard]
MADVPVVLPRYVAFEGDNGMFLGAHWQDKREYQRFGFTESGHERVKQEIVPLDDGSGNIMIKNCHWNKFWRRSPNWIWADAISPSPSDKYCVFQPIQLGSQLVALRCLANNNILSRLTTEGKESCLNASTPTITETGRLIVMEPVIRRRIYDIKYDMDTAQIYDIRPLVLGTRDAVNNSPYPGTVSVSIAYTQSESYSWNNSTTVTTGVQVSISAGIPEVAGTSVTVSTEVSLTTEMGKTVENSTTLTDTYTVESLPPGGKVTVTLNATQAKCKVNYSYTQEDLLTNGEVLTFHKSDGEFLGLNFSTVNWHAT